MLQNILFILQSVSILSKNILSGVAEATIWFASAIRPFALRVLGDQLVLKKSSGFVREHTLLIFF